MTRVWREAVSLPKGGWYYRCLVELDCEGQLTTYSCEPGYYAKLGVGQTVRLHLKGDYAEYLRVLSKAKHEA